MIHIQLMLLQNSRLGGRGCEGCPDMFLLFYYVNFRNLNFPGGRLGPGPPPPPTLDPRMISFNFLVKKWGEGRGWFLHLIKTFIIFSFIGFTIKYIVYFVWFSNSSIDFLYTSNQPIFYPILHVIMVNSHPKCNVLYLKHTIKNWQKRKWILM